VDGPAKPEGTPRGLPIQNVFETVLVCPQEFVITAVSVCDPLLMKLRVACVFDRLDKVAILVLDKLQTTV
jgi:hypothetical protein